MSEPMSERAAARVIVMAKAPVAGYAKTRLVPALGADGAARLALRFLAETVGQALAAGIGPVEVCCAPDARHAAFLAHARNGRVALTEQGEGDLGERMARAMQRALTMVSRVILVGTDAPALDAPCLRAACAALAEHDAVFAPTLDGGYALIGLRVLEPALFENMPWGTGHVMAITRERLALAGLRHAELATLADVDEPADLAHVPPAWL